MHNVNSEFGGFEKSFNVSELRPTTDCLSRAVTHQLRWLSVWLCGWGGFRWQTWGRPRWGPRMCVDPRRFSEASIVLSTKGRDNNNNKHCYCRSTNKSSQFIEMRQKGGRILFNFTWGGEVRVLWSLPGVRVPFSKNKTKKKGINKFLKIHLQINALLYLFIISFL